MPRFVVHLFERLAEIFELLATMPFFRSVKIVHKCLHTNEARIIELFENTQRSK